MASERTRHLTGYLERTYEHRQRVVVPVPLDYGVQGELHLPVDLSTAEAERVSRMVLAWAVPDSPPLDGNHSTGPEDA